ncbi:hypothetical protein Tco_0750375 [Tanacetum coccineum]|uniref:Uncharacterized protein n=1 Tax=Tanacetum coccineum TaxID=301880 RepID=A0ABQ4Z138_9ASTR
MSPAPPTTATPVASHHQHHRYPSPHHPHRLHLAIISPTRKPPSPPPYVTAATPPPRRVFGCWVHNTSGVFVSGFIAKTRVCVAGHPGGPIRKLAYYFVERERSAVNSTLWTFSNGLDFSSLRGQSLQLSPLQMLTSKFGFTMYIFL